MAYNRKKWSFEVCNEYEYSYAGRYGAKGEKRSPRAKPTPEQIARQNQTNRRNYVRRVALLNFHQGDLWTTLKYPAGVKPNADRVKKDFKAFRGILRRSYKKEGHQLKYIYRAEIGKRGGVHVHILLNRIRGTPIDLLIEEAWSKCLKKSIGEGVRTEGLADYKTAYEAGGFRQLADYITKSPQPGSGEYEQLSLFSEDERKQYVKFGTSRNLARPESVMEEKKYSHWTMRKLIEEGPKPSEGYYIDKDSIVCGTNPYTGMGYYRYTEFKLKRGREP